VISGSLLLKLFVVDEAVFGGGEDASLVLPLSLLIFFAVWIWFDWLCNNSASAAILIYYLMNEFVGIFENSDLI
jgi:hypothetical protein